MLLNIESYMIDIIICVYFIFSIIKGYRIGFFYGFYYGLSRIFVFVLSFILSNYILNDKISTHPVISFFIILLILSLIFKIFINPKIRKLGNKFKKLSFVSKILGGILYGIKSLIIISIILTMINVIFVNAKDKINDTTLAKEIVTITNREILENE